MDKIGENIRRIRKAKGLSMNDVAEKVGLTYPGYQQIEKGRNTTIEKIWKIAEVLEVSPSDLLGFEEQFSTQKINELQMVLQERIAEKKSIEAESKKKDIIIGKLFMELNNRVGRELTDRFRDFYSKLEANKSKNELLLGHELKRICADPSEKTNRLVFEAFFKDKGIRSLFEGLERNEENALNRDIGEILTSESLSFFSVDNQKDNWLAIWEIYKENGDWNDAPSIHFKPKRINSFLY